jgi:hypothetical protein
MWKVVSHIKEENRLRVFRNRVLRKCVGLRGRKYKRLKEMEI